MTKDGMFDQTLKYRYEEFNGVTANICLWEATEILMTHGFKFMGLTKS